MAKGSSQEVYVGVNKSTFETCLCTTKQAVADGLNVSVMTVNRILGKKDHPRFYIDRLPIQRLTKRHLNLRK
jgi:DNA invertase Pin-like site-specific DNA recombinase